MEIPNPADAEKVEKNYKGWIILALTVMCFALVTVVIVRNDAPAKDCKEEKAEQAREIDSLSRGLNKAKDRIQDLAVQNAVLLERQHRFVKSAVKTDSMISEKVIPAKKLVE